MSQVIVRNSSTKGVNPPLSFGSLYVNGDRFPLHGQRPVTADVPGGDVRILLFFSWSRCGVWVGTADAAATLELEYWHGDVTDIGAGRAVVDALSVGQTELVNTHSAERRFTWRLFVALFVGYLTAGAIVLAVSSAAGLAAGFVPLLVLLLLVAAVCAWTVASRRQGRRLTTIPQVGPW